MYLALQYSQARTVFGYMKAVTESGKGGTKWRKYMKMCMFCHVKFTLMIFNWNADGKSASHSSFVASFCD